MRDIPVAQWSEFLEQFSREHRAWLASVERVHPAAPRRVEVNERPLLSIDSDAADGIVFRFDERSVRIDAPKALRVEETEDGVVQGIELEDWSGERASLRFRVAARPEALDGIAPGEF
jgi:hypothetical protein